MFYYITKPYEKAKISALFYKKTPKYPLLPADAAIIFCCFDE